MTADEKRQGVARAKNGSIIESIGMSLERFNRHLSDDRKVRLFAMNHADLRKLDIDLRKTETGLKAISLIVNAIATSSPTAVLERQPQPAAVTARPRKAK